MKTLEKSLLYVLLTLLMLAACSDGDFRRSGQTNENVTRYVKTDTVTAYSEKQKAVFPGKIVAAADVSLSFRVAGTIARLNVEAGNFVRRGQVLASLDSRDYELQLAATEAEYKRIKAEAERVIELHGTGSVTDNDYDKAVYGLQQITAKLDAHRNALADTRLVAPFDGYVQKRYFAGNETVGAGMPVLSMIDAGAPEVEINIPSSEYILQDRFDEFSCSVDIFPDKKFGLDLLGITRKANMNQLYTMRLKMRNADAPLPPPGMVTMVEIQYKPEQTHLVSIPYSAMFENGGESSAWIYNTDNETVSVRKIKPVEIRTDGRVIVSDGLSEGEIIVTAGVHSLHEGEKVRILKPTAITNAGGLL